MTQLRIDDFKVPLELLAKYTRVMERWQLEEPVTALLRRLVATFEPQAVPPHPNDHVIGEETEVRRVDPDPENSDDERDDKDDKQE